MHKKKTISKVSAAGLAAILALQGFSPAITLADEEPDTPEQIPEITEETSDPEEVTEDAPVYTDISVAEDPEDYIGKVSDLSEEDTLVISTTDEIAEIGADEGVYFEGSYTFTFSNEDAYNNAIEYAQESGYAIATDELFTVCGMTESDYFETLSGGGLKVAVIDTGSNNANEAVSVIGDDGTDQNGHGTAMCNEILANCTTDVYLLSIKAIGDNGTGTATDVYSAVKYAIDKECDVIFMANSMKDSPDNDALELLIDSALCNGITVIAAAGNSGADAADYTPANIPGVITAGAMDKDGYKVSSSNYGSCVDYYLVAESTSQAAAILTGKLLSDDTEGISFLYLEPEEQTPETVTTTTEEGTLTIEITPVLEYDDKGFLIAGTTVTGNHVRVVWSFGTHYWSSVERAQHRTTIKNELSGINGISNIEVTFYPQATSANYNNGGYETAQCVVEFDVDSIQDIVGGSSFYNAVTTLNSMGDKSYAGGVVVIGWDDVAQAINNNAKSSADSSGYTVQTVNGWVRRVCHGPYNRPNINATTYCSEPGVAFNDNYTVTVYGNDTSGDVPVDALGGYMAEAAARVLASSQSEQAKQGFVWACKGLTVATAVATDPGADAFPVQQYNGGTVSLNMSTSSAMVNGELFAVPGQTYTFTDANGQIGNYTAVSSYSGVTATISGNDLIISVSANADPAQIKNTTISLECSSGYTGPVETVWHLYVYSSDGQDQVRGEYERKQAHFDAEPWSVGLVSEVYVDIVKSSSDTAIVANNNCYDLAGTSYGLYTSDGTLVHTFNISSTGDTASYTITDLTKSYYVKEITAGKGYNLDTATYPVNWSDADSTNTIVFDFKDTPMTDPLNWSLVKVDPKGYNNVTGLSLSGAVFNVSYYDTTNVNSIADALALTNPYESVNLTAQTDAPGAAKICISSTSLSAASNYFASFGKRELPLGTYVVREVSAPTGYNPVPTNSAYVLVIYQGSDGMQHYKYYSSNQYFYTLATETAQIYEPPKTGSAKFFKDSTINTDLATIAPTLYDLSGTKYEIYYTDSNKLTCTVTFETSGKMNSAVFPTGVNGVFSYNDQTIELPVGNYYAKEIQTGKGYYLNSGSQSFTVTEGNTTSVTFDDEPMYADFELVLSKLVTATGISQDAADLYSVKGAVFCVNYYNEIVPESDLGTTTPTKSWFFETDEDGKIFYTSGYLTSTSYYLDEQGIITLFRDSNGNYVAPQGTYTVTEVSAPEGMYVNPTTYVRYLVLGSNIVKGSTDDPANSNAWALTVDGDVIVPETPFVPTIDTVAMASDGSKEIAAMPNQTITDTVSYMNLVSGYEYKIKGALFLTDGTSLGVTAEKDITFTTAGSVSGSIDMDFVLDATGLEGKTIVVIEDLYVTDSNGNEILFVSHADLNDTDQQITIPDIETTLLDTAIDNWDPTTSFGSTFTNSQGYTKHVSYGTKVTLTDFVLYTNLTVGYTYTVTGTLKNKANGEDILDINGNPITGTATFTASSSDGLVEVLFEDVDTTGLAGISSVAFETLSRNGIDLVSHSDLTDEAQTLPAPPEIKTTATTDDGEKEIPYTDKVTIVDVVSFEGLVPGKTYTVSGNLYNADTGAILYDEDGYVYFASTTFTATSSSGTAEVVFKDVYVPFDIEGIVVFENLYYDGMRIATHADLSDEDQTITFVHPEIKTNATEEVTGEKVIPCSETVTVVDEVSFDGLVKGKTYEVVGTLYNADTGEELMDESGNKITANTEFTAIASTGTAKVIFNEVYVPYTVEKVVVFEDLYYDGLKIAVHADLTDQDQTLHRASASTVAVSDSGSKTVVIGASATIVDTISYEGLIPGKLYRAEGTLYKKDGSEVLNADGSPVKASTDFIPEEANGTTTVTFTFDTAGFTEEDAVVVFETIYDVAEESETQTEDIVIAKHEDLSDENQTIGFVQPDIPATGETIAISTVAGLILISVAGAVITIRFRKKET